jgi:hypothetical protein
LFHLVWWLQYVSRPFAFFFFGFSTSFLKLIRDWIHL